MPWFHSWTWMGYDFFFIKIFHKPKCLWKLSLCAEDTDTDLTGSHFLLPLSTHQKAAVDKAWISMLGLRAEGPVPIQMYSVMRRATAGHSAPWRIYQLGGMCACGEGACSACDWLGIACIPVGKLAQLLQIWHHGVMKTPSLPETNWPLPSFRNSQRSQEDRQLPLRAAVLLWGFGQSNIKLLSLGGKQTPWNADEDTLSRWSYFICPSWIHSNLFLLNLIFITLKLSKV